MQQDDAPCCWVGQGRFHGILPEEYSGTLQGLQWGLYEGMPTNTWGCNLSEIYLSKQTFFLQKLLK